MHFSSFVVFAIFAVSIARCAPALDATTLANNAKQAQQLNAQFITLKVTDPCQGQETACIHGAIATCVNGKFDTSNGICPLGQQCFATPNVRSQGTSLLCTSESNVVSLMNAAGVSGGVTGSDNVSSSTTTTTSSTTTSTTTTSSSTGNPSDVTVTVTVTASSVSTTTTTTVSPSDASSILSQFLSNGQPLPTSTSSSSVPALTPVAAPGSIPPSGTPSAIVSLTAAGDPTNPTPSPTTTSSGNVVQLTAAPNVASPSTFTSAPSPSVPVPVGAGGGAGYGGY